MLIGVHSAGSFFGRFFAKCRFAALGVSRPIFAAPRQRTSFASRKPWLVPPSGSSSRMSAASSEDARGILRSFSAALDEPQKSKLDSYLSHMGHVGDEMVAGLGGMFTDSFPEVPSLDQIHETYTFSKTDALLLGAHLGTDGWIMTTSANNADKVMAVASVGCAGMWGA